MRSIYLFFFLFACGLFAKSASVPCFQEMETDDCFIAFLDSEYLVKQIKDPDPDEQFLLVLDATSSQIAASLNLPINRVELISPNIPFRGKKILEHPATLHTRAPGASLPESDLEVRIHQRVCKANRPGKWPLPPEQEGLSPTVIENMSRHEDLPRIAAFDTFVGNGDRSQPNLFYDPKSDRYFGIDLAASFCSELGAAACKQVRWFQDERRSFSLEEREALASYTKTLEQLVKIWSPEAMERLLLETAERAGLESADRIHFHCRIIQSNYNSAVELVKLLRALL